MKHDSGKDGDSADAGYGPRIICIEEDLMHEKAQTKESVTGQALNNHAQSELRPVGRRPTNHSFLDIDLYRVELVFCID